MRFQFVPFGGEAPEGAAACDGLVPGAKIDLSHWAHNKTPRHLKADTSVEIALNFARERSRYDVELAANNHFDADGVLAVWTLLKPELALEHASLITAAAEVGDFDVWPSDDRGIWLETAIAKIAWKKQDRGSYETVLAALDDLVPNLDREERLWGESYRKLLDAKRSIDRGAVQIETNGRITTIVHDEGTPELPGAWIAKLADTSSDRWLLAFEKDGLYSYRYERPRWAWADTVKRPQIRTPRRGPFKRLGPEWNIKGTLGMTGLAYTNRPVRAKPEDVARMLRGLDP